MAHKPVLVLLPLDACQTVSGIEETLTAVLDDFDETQQWDEWLIGDEHHAMLPLLRSALPHEVHISACAPERCQAHPHAGRVDGAPVGAIDWDRINAIRFGRCDLLDFEKNWHPRPPESIDHPGHRVTVAHRTRLRSILTGLGDSAYAITVTFRR